MGAWDESNPDSFKGLDPRRHTMQQVYEKFGLAESTTDFIGHAVALHPNDEYLSQACGPTIAKCQLYLNSVLQYGGSPFIYPIYGLHYLQLLPHLILYDSFTSFHLGDLFSRDYCCKSQRLKYRKRKTNK